jgi:Mg2+ and Co2+ transporter CorA
MTGLFGMNFVDAAGDPEPKMLSWNQGYNVFWLLSIVSTAALYALFKFKLNVF